MLHYSGTIESKMCQKNVEEPCPKLTQQYSTGWMEKNWKAYLHAMLMISSGEAQNFKQTVVQEIRLEKKKARHFNTLGWSCSQITTQFSYIRAGMDKAWSQSHWKRAERFRNKVMSAQEKQSYRSKIGQILWTSS